MNESLNQGKTREESVEACCVNQANEKVNGVFVRIKQNLMTIKTLVVKGCHPGILFLTMKFYKKFRKKTTKMKTNGIIY